MNRTDWFRDLAPHVDRAWREQFVLELRLGSVSGERLGAALAEVDSHLADSGETAAEAFGDAAEYARSLGLPPSPQQSSWASVQAALPVALQLPGLVLAVSASGDAATGAPWAVRPIGIGIVVLFVAAYLCASVWGTRPMRWIARVRGRAFVTLFVVGLVSMVAGLNASHWEDGLGGPTWHLPSRWALAVGLTAVGVGAVLAWTTFRRRLDLVRLPLDDAAVVPRGPIRVAQSMMVAPAVATVALVVVGWLQGSR